MRNTWLTMPALLLAAALAGLLIFVTGRLRRRNR